MPHITFASKTSLNQFAAGMRQRSLQILKFIFPLARDASAFFYWKAGAFPMVKATEGRVRHGGTLSPLMLQSMSGASVGFVVEASCRPSSYRSFDVPGACPAFRSIPSGIGDSSISFSAVASRQHLPHGYSMISRPRTALFMAEALKAFGVLRHKLRNGATSCAERPAGLRCRIR